MKNSIFLKTVFFVLSVSIIVSAQKKSAQKNDSLKTYLLKEVVVTATKTKTPKFTVASSISVIDSKEISNSNKTTILDLLSNQYGVSITSQGGRGNLSQVYLRGASPGYTLVQIDGIEMNMPNDPNNVFDFTDLAVDNIEKVEILRGPQSTLYGADALAGVINIITKKGKGKPSFSFLTEGGSYNSYKGLMSLSGSRNNFNYSFSFSREKTDGFSSADSKFGNTEKDGSSRYNINSRLGLKVTDNFALNLFAHFTKAETNFDQFGGRFGDDPTYIYNLEQGAYKLEGSLSLLNGQWTQKFGVSIIKNLRKYRFDPSAFNPAASRSFYDGRKTKYEWQNNFKFNNNLLTFGVETEQERANSDYLWYNNSFTFRSVLPEKELRTTGVYAQDQFNILNNLFASAGIRYDNHEKFGSVFTFRIAPAYIIWETSTKIKFTYGTGFKAPSLFYLFDPTFGNDKLNPEKSRGWDLGFEQYLLDTKLLLGAAYFSNTFDNLFGTDSNFKTVNIGKATTNGVEFYLTYKPNSKLKVNANYTYTNSKNKDVNSAEFNLALLRRPVNKATLVFNYNLNSNINLNTDINYVDARIDKDFSSFPAKRILLQSYILVNFAVNIRMIHNLKLYGRIVNLFNTDYEEVFGYGTAKRSGYVGLKINL